ncbi:hypothetical protein A0H81_02894 [Grifola frondosa]|uniref:Uncharacterized protein n=1 Tax=Grifola frondosa TaxID=5627 RepID=A0A1C7MMI5_GRIFR|nr:hypothetical protein A0H81_02894 [Grifola frondosa]
MCLNDEQEAASFVQFLEDFGHGRNMDEDQNITLPSYMKANDIDSLIDFIYPDVDSTPPPPPEYFLHHVILSTWNTDVDDIND